MRRVLFIVACILSTQSLICMEQTKKLDTTQLTDLPYDMLLEIGMHAGLQEAKWTQIRSYVVIKEETCKFTMSSGGRAVKLPPQEVLTSFGKAITCYALVCKQFAALHDQLLKQFIQKNQSALASIYDYFWASVRQHKIVLMLCRYKVPTIEMYMPRQSGLYTYKDDWSLLHCAAHYCTIDLIEPFVQSGIAVNITDHSGVTPLHVASYQSRHVEIIGQNYLDAILRCIRTLLTLGADPTIKDLQGKTAFDYAGSTEEVKTLLATHKKENL